MKTQMRVLLLLVLVFLSGVLRAEVTEKEREQFWKLMNDQYAKNQQVIYNDGKKGAPDYPAYLVSNESSFVSMNPPEGGAELQVGFGTTMNFNLAAARKPKALLIADQSLEAQTMINSFYRPLFLLAETPEQFVSYLSGLVPKRRETVDGIFSRVAAGELPSSKAIEDLKQNLKPLIQRGVVTELDARFIELVLKEQGAEFPDKTVSIFRNAEHSKTIVRDFSELYDVNTHEQKIERGFRWEVARHKALLPLMVRDQGAVLDEEDANKQKEAILDRQEASLKRLSFLTPEGFATVKNLFAKDAIYFAKGAIEREALWKAITEFADKKKLKISDLYLSNIPYVLDPAQTEKTRVALINTFGVPERSDVIMYMAPLRPELPFASGGVIFQEDGVLHFQNDHLHPQNSICLRLMRDLGKKKKK